MDEKMTPFLASGVWCTRSPAHLVRCRDALSRSIVQHHPAHYAPTAQGLIADSGYLLYLGRQRARIALYCRLPRSLHATPFQMEGHRER